MALVNELTVEELMDLLKHEMQDVVREAIRDVISETQKPQQDQMAILDIPLLDIGEWPRRGEGCPRLYDLRRMWSGRILEEVVAYGGRRMMRSVFA